MRQWLVVGLALGLVMTSTPAREGIAAEMEATAAVVVEPECPTLTPERPHICDIGEPRPLSMRSFNEILRRDEVIRELVRRIGMPDRVELQDVDVWHPWMAWELRTYYRRYNKMFVFAQALLFGEPQITMLRHQGPLPARLIEASLVSPDASLSRADRAAEDAERAADRAERAADRTSAVGDKLADSFMHSLRKK